MPAKILDGTKIANDIRSEVAAEVKTMVAAGVRPGLAVVLVGHNPASEIYVRGKVKASNEVGLYSEQHTPPETATTAELLALIEDLNRRDKIDGGRSRQGCRRLPSRQRRLPLYAASRPGPVYACRSR